jgi:hypothetical protein
MTEERSNGATGRVVTDRMIASWRLCIEHKHEPQPGLGQFDWPRVLTRALDEIERLRADNERISAAWAEVIQREERTDNAAAFDLAAAQAKIGRLRLDLGAINDLTGADRPYDWRLDRIREITRTAVGEDV